MFYKKGLDITKDRDMFNFLHDHFTYATLNSWNGCYSVANNVKVYNLHLSGNEWTALRFLENFDYGPVNDMIYDWEAEHEGYKVGFNGRSGGYLVLYNEDNNQNVLPDCITDCDNYEEYKEYCREEYGSVKANRRDLVYYTKLVQDFDKLCDEMRDYVDELSNMDFAKYNTEDAVESFNINYDEDLEFCKFSPLEVTEEGKVDITEISAMASLFKVFRELLDRSDYGYSIVCKDNLMWLEEN